MLQLDLALGLPRVQAAGRFLAPAGRYFPAMLPEAAPPEQLAELAVVDACGRSWTPRCPSRSSGLIRRTVMDSCGPEHSPENRKAARARLLGKEAPSETASSSYGGRHE